MSMSVCLHNGTLLTGFSQMEKCAVLLEDGKVAEVFSEHRFLQKKFVSNQRAAYTTRINFIYLYACIF